MKKHGEIRGSLFVELGLIVDAVLVLQCLFAPALVRTGASVAWISDDSSVVHWGLLYGWAALGALPVLLAIRGRNRAAYLVLPAAYAAYWLIEFGFRVHAGELREIGDETLPVLLCGLAVWGVSVRAIQPADSLDVGDVASSC